MVDHVDHDAQNYIARGKLVIFFAVDLVELRIGKLAENSRTIVERIAELLDDKRFVDLGVGGRFGVRGFDVCNEGAVAVVGLRDMAIC